MSNQISGEIKNKGIITNGTISSNTKLFGTLSDKKSVTGNIMETILVGLSAYEVAKKNGYEGTEEEWLYSLGVHVRVVSDEDHEYILAIETMDGEIITPNLKPILIKGIDYLTPEDIAELLEEIYAETDLVYAKIESLNDVDDKLNEHIEDIIIHITNDERNKWNEKSNISANPIITDDTEELSSITIDGKDYKVINKNIEQRVETLEVEIETKADDEEFNSHAQNEDIHVTLEEKASWVNKVTSVNEMIGDVVLNAQLVHALPDDTFIPTSKEDIGLGNVNNTSDMSKPVSTAQNEAITGSLNIAKNYTDQKIADLINGAPETLDTLKEIADAMATQHSVVEALEEAIGTKTNKSDFNDHVNNTIKHITSAERETWNAKSDFDGNYNSLTNKPEIETENIDFSNYFGGDE